jgi:23S rRNA pseudouridine2605 synthase
MRLQKLLADAGFGARRKCEALIEAGRVRVNGEVARIGTSVNPGDRVELDGRPVRAAAHVYIALHKPEGYASDRSQARNRDVFELVDVPTRLYAAGRLDMDSSGLLLLTNDGDLALQLTHPRFGHDKEYHVQVRGVPGEVVLARWRKGVLLDDEPTPTLPCAVSVMRRADGGALLRIIMREGRKRQIRRVASLLGYPVVSLKRMRIGPLKLGALESGRWRALTHEEITALRRIA